MLASSKHWLNAPLLLAAGSSKIASIFRVYERKFSVTDSNYSGNETHVAVAVENHMSDIEFKWNYNVQRK